MKMPKKILVPMDGSKISKLAYDQAIKLAKRINANVTLIHVLEPINFDFESFGYPYIDPPYNISEKGNKIIMKLILNGLAGEGKKEGINVGSTIVEGQVANEIIRMSRNYDIIIMGLLSHSALSRLLFGSNAEKVARKANCPVMLIREIYKKGKKMLGEVS